MGLPFFFKASFLWSKKAVLIRVHSNSLDNQLAVFWYLSFKTPNIFVLDFPTLESLVSKSMNWNLSKFWYLRKNDLRSKIGHVTSPKISPTLHPTFGPASPGGFGVPGHWHRDQLFVTGLRKLLLSTHGSRVNMTPVNKSNRNKRYLWQLKVCVQNNVTDLRSILKVGHSC